MRETVELLTLLRTLQSGRLNCFGIMQGIWLTTGEV